MVNFYVMTIYNNAHFKMLYLLAIGKKFGSHKNGEHLFPVEWLKQELRKTFILKILFKKDI